MLYLNDGLKNSLIVLEILRNDNSLYDVPIIVGTFTNCREQGLTFSISEKEAFTWCVYQHRNTDSIIINGKEGFISMNGDLPYCSNSKWKNLAEFDCGRHTEAAKFLTEMLKKYYEKHKF